MPALLIVILCSTTVGFVLKYSESKSFNRAVVTSANYFFGFIAAGIMFLFREEPRPFQTEDTFFVALGLGVLLGFSYFVGLILRQIAIREKGVAVTNSFSKLNILVPMILSLILWREIPDFFSSIAVLLFVGAILVSSFDKEKVIQIGHLGKNVVLLILVAGFSGFINKLFQQYSLLEYKSFYLMIVFLMAFAASLTMAIHKGDMPRGREILAGFLVGIPNLLRSSFMIIALHQLSTAVAFSFSSAGSIMATAIGARFIFKERIPRKDQIAIGIIVIALILVNINR